jgi:hypothetical protein
MYNKEKAKENYINNRDKLNEKAKQYYHDNKEARQKYNNEYWTEHKHKYAELRRHDREYKRKQKEYYEIHKDLPKIKIERQKSAKNSKLTMVLNNHKLPVLTVSHILYFN